MNKKSELMKDKYDHNLQLKFYTVGIPKNELTCLIM